ncbi:MAG: hypothetical protein KIS91_03220 [Anaerolineae bacterium]|nr:hypothetical protein [Anaerolineae bacterium]
MTPTPLPRPVADQRPQPIEAARGTLLGAGWFLTVFFLARWAAPALPLAPAVGLLATTALFVVAILPIEYFGGALNLPTLGGWAILGVVGALALGFNVFLTNAQSPGAASLSLLLGAVIIGVLIGRFALVDRDLVLLIAVLYIIIDAYSVFFGPTQAILQRGGTLVSALTIRFPILGTERIAPLVGATDFLVWAACAQAAYRFQFPYRRSHAALALGLLGSAVVSIAVGRAVPALPLMMAAYLAVNARQFNWRKPSLWALGAALLAIVLGVGFLARRALAP